jgi:hypothetical protein
VDFTALMEGDLTQSFIDGFRQIYAGMDDVRPRSAASGLSGRAGGAWLGSGALGHPDRAYGLPFLGAL